MTSFMHKPSVAGQSIVDRALAAKHTVSGSGVAKVVCKATTEEVMGPKRKHLDYLLHCTNDSNVSIPQLANLLIERTQNSNWVVVFKALVTMHNLMNYGNERFTQFLASNNCHLNLANFTDRTSSLGYSMSVFIRRYARYLNQKASSYRVMAFDFCKVKRGKEDGLLRTMNTEKLLKALPIVHAQLEALVEFEVDVNDLSNGVINGCFMLMFKDLIRLFACYNDGIINLLEKYFDMNKKQCKDALDVYKKFLARTDRVCVFLKVAENVGIDKGDIPDLAKAPSSLLEALEQHLNSLENTKKTTTTLSSSTAGASSNAAPPKPSAGFTTAISTYRTETERGLAPGAGASLSDISDQERALILEEEQRQLDIMRQRRINQSSAEPVYTAPAPRPATAAPVLTSSAAQQSAPPTINELPQGFVEFVDNYNFSSKHADDLLGLDPSLQAPSALGPNFAAFSEFNGSSVGMNGSAFAANNPFIASSSVSAAPASAVDLSWASQPAPSNQLKGSAHTAAATNTGPGLDLFGGSVASSSSMSMLAPITTKPGGIGTASLSAGHTYQPSPARTISSAPMSPTNSGSVSLEVGGVNGKGDRLIKTNDIDSSLANLAGNLNVKSTYLKKSEHQWKGDVGEKKLTGAPLNSASSTGWTSNISQASASAASSGVYWNQSAPLNSVYQQPSMQQPAYNILGGAMPPQAMLGGPPVGSYAVPMGGPVMLIPTAQPGWSQQQSAYTISATQQQQPVNDPFGAL